jgi:hypothetical protein
VDPAPDDLPRSPTGRLPQWVLDERRGVTGPPPGWRGDPGLLPTPRRRPRGRLLAAGLVTVLAVAGWFATGLPTPPGDLVAALTAGLADGPRGAAREAPAPSAASVALADAAHLTDEGRRLFYGTRPQVLDQAAFAGRCSGLGAAPRARSDGAVGCYLGGTDSIVIYQPADARLFGSAVETAAHELLHAAWVRLEPLERARLTSTLEAVVASLAPDDPVHEQIAGSVGSRPENRPTELFAYVGTQVWRDGGLDPDLEAVYARFVADRPALVATHTAWVSALEGMSSDIDAAIQALAARESADAQERAQHGADLASVEHYRAQYQAEAAELDAMSAERRRRVQLSWVWWDGTDLPMAAADETMATAAALLARDDVDLPVRGTALDAAEAATAAERARVEGLIAELQELNRQLSPATGGG